MSMETFGNESDVATVRAFREACIADGWDHRPTYADHEPEESACKLTLDGFVISTISRDARKDQLGYPIKCSASIHAWGPDGMAIKVDIPYAGFDALKAATRCCNLCGLADVDTFRYSFAGRACKACIPAARQKYEKPGWNN